jgi:hypothetical protein
LALFQQQVGVVVVAEMTLSVNPLKLEVVVVVAVEATRVTAARQGIPHQLHHRKVTPEEMPTLFLEFPVTGALAVVAQVQ